jgi:hypothetical protein
LPFLLAVGPPEFQIDSVRGEPVSGPLVRLGADGSAQVGTSSPNPGADVVSIRRVGQPPPRLPHDRPHLHLVNGDRIPGRLVAIVGDKIRFVADLGTEQEVTVPLSGLAAVWLTSESDVRHPEKQREDLVLLTNGDTTAGTVVAWPTDGPLRLEVGGREVAVPRERIRGILFNTELARLPKPRSTFRQLVLANGGRLSVRSVELVADECRATTLTGAAVRVPVRALAEVNTYGGPAVYLSDLTPKSYERTPFLGVAWPLMNDRNVAGGDLRLGGGTYDKGVGMHSKSRATYAVPAGSTRFETVVGLDEATGRRGDVVIQVLADGKPLLTPIVLSGTDPPRQLRLSLPPGTKELTLLVDYGRGGDVQDHVDWGDARVISAGAARP